MKFFGFTLAVTLAAIAAIASPIRKREVGGVSTTIFSNVFRIMY